MLHAVTFPFVRLIQKFKKKVRLSKLTLYFEENIELAQELRLGKSENLRVKCLITTIYLIENNYNYCSQGKFTEYNN